MVTGGAGFVGRHLVDALVARGDQVRVVDRADPGRDDVEHLCADITDEAAMAEAVKGAASVFHNASVVHTKQNQVDFVWKVNLDGTRHVLRGCQAAGVPKLVYVSSGSVVYQGQDIENGDESLPYSSISQAPYADSKIEAEKEVLAANGEEGVATVALRPHVIFGPGDERFLPALIKHAKSGKLRYQVGRGTWLSDYTYVGNLVDALLAADQRLSLDAPVAGQAYFITNGEPMPFWDFVRKVLARLDLPPLRGKSPPARLRHCRRQRRHRHPTRWHISPEDGLTRFAIRYMCTHHYFRIDKARRDLGYDPRVTVDEGIERTCAHLQATGF